MKILRIAILLIALPSFAQTGIGTTNPGATLEVVGNPTSTTSMDGIIPPKITGDQLAAKTYTASQEGAIVYVTTTPSSQTGQVINVNQAGVYSFNGTIWVKLAATSVGFIPSVTATGKSVPSTEFQPTGTSWTLTNEVSLLTGSGLDASGTFTAPASGFYQINVHMEYRAVAAQSITLFIGDAVCAACSESNGIILNNFLIRGIGLMWSSLNASGILYLNSGQSVSPVTLSRGSGVSFDADHLVRNINFIIQHVGE